MAHSLREHLQQYLPHALPQVSSSTLLISFEQFEKPFISIRDITATNARFVTAVGQIAHSSKRNGVLLLKDSTGSIPVTVCNELRDPKLLGAVVACSKFSFVPLKTWEEATGSTARDENPNVMMVKPEEWLKNSAKIDNVQHVPHKRVKPAAATAGSPQKSHKKGFLELFGGDEFFVISAPLRLDESVIRDHVENENTMSTRHEVFGTVSGLSPVVRTTNQQELYFVIELTDNRCITVFGQQNEALRLLLRIGIMYTFSPLVKEQVKFANFIVDGYICTSETKLECVRIGMDDSPVAAIDSIYSDTTSSPAERTNSELRKQESDHKVNLFSYQGYVTAHPAEFVFELDSKYKVMLHAIPKGLWLGVREGARVLLRSLCQINFRGEMVGFEGTFRTDLEILEFSAVREGFQARFPSVKKPLDVNLEGIVYYAALDFVAQCRRYNTFSEIEERSDQQLFEVGKALLENDCDAPFSLLNPGSIHPVVRFLYEWEIPFRSNLHIPRFLMDLSNAVVETLEEYSKRKTPRVTSSFQKSFDGVLLLGKIQTSQLTGQLCLYQARAGHHGAFDCIECIVNKIGRPVTKDILGVLLSISSFDVIIEHAVPDQSVQTAIPTSRENVKTCLDSDYPRTSKGKALWHGYINSENMLGFTRALIRVRDATKWDETRIPSTDDVASSTQTNIAGSSSFAFDQMTGDTVYTSACVWQNGSLEKVKSEGFPPDFALRNISSQIGRDESVACVARTRLIPPRIFFVILAYEIVPARKYDKTFEKERSNKLQRLGCHQPKIFTDCALKLVVRDLWTPDRLDVFVSLENRIFPAGLLSSSAKTMEETVWMVFGTGISFGGNSGTGGRSYLQVNSKSNFVHVNITTEIEQSIAKYPRDLAKLPHGSLAGIRSATNASQGCCVLLSIVQVFWARLSYHCPIGCASMGRSCACSLFDDSLYKLQILVEADDGTDQSQVFADGHKAFELLNIPRRKLKEFCGHSVRKLGRIDYRLNAECEINSPQGLFRSFLLNGGAETPRRAFVTKDRPITDKQGKFENAFQYTFMSSVSGGDFEYAAVDEASSADDYNRFAYVRNHQEMRVKTNLRGRLTVNLLEIEPVTDYEQELNRTLLGGSSSF